MAVTKKEMYENILKDIDSDDDIITSAIVTNDGLMMAATSVEDLHYELFAAVCASAVASSQDAMNEMANESTDMLIMEGKKHRIIIMRVTDRILLTTFANIEAQLGMVLIKMSRAREKIKSIR